MKWELRVYRRDGSLMTSIYTETRRYARSKMSDISEVINDLDSYWLETPDSSYLLRPEDFGGCEIAKDES